jgi:sugar O-acyltransferase (sialic acid O-acetyltransferase NeuD family)
VTVSVSRRLVVIGCGGHAREILDIVEDVNRAAPIFEFMGAVVEPDWDAGLFRERGVPLVGGVDVMEHLDSDYVIAIGDGTTRARIDAQATSWGRSAATIVHPTATVGSDARLSPGCVLFAGARVSTRARLGRHVHVNFNATVSHDTVVGNYVTLSPGASIAGRVVVSDLVMVGINAAVIPDVSIGEGTMVGAGAVVISDLPPKVVAVGVPARVRTREGANDERE